MSDQQLCILTHVEKTGVDECPSYQEDEEVNDVPFVDKACLVDVEHLGYLNQNLL